jgi:predicted ester cyclase
MNLVRRVLRGRDAFEEIYHPNVVNHPPHPKRGIEAIHEISRKYTSALSNFRADIEEQFPAGEKGDLVVTVWKARGTHTGSLETPLGTLPPTNNEVEFMLITVVRVVDGQIVERWGQI